MTEYIGDKEIWKCLSEKPLSDVVHNQVMMLEEYIEDITMVIENEGTAEMSVTFKHPNFQIAVTGANLSGG